MIDGNKLPFLSLLHPPVTMGTGICRALPSLSCLPPPVSTGAGMGYFSLQSAAILGLLLGNWKR
eukprot:6456754-Amphidinium_carterae.1